VATRYAHTNIISEDWQKLACFYEQVFECVLVPPKRLQSGEWLEQATGVPQATLEGVHLRLPGHGDNGPTLEIFSYGEMKEKALPLANRKGFGHIAFEVDDVKTTVEKLMNYGGKLVGSIVEKEVPSVGLITVVYAADPEGNIVEIQHWAEVPA
jgi:predicted enzyme related to lactoylglutathione lyase